MVVGRDAGGMTDPRGDEQEFATEDQRRSEAERGSVVHESVLLGRLVLEHCLTGEIARPVRTGGKFLPSFNYPFAAQARAAYPAGRHHISEPQPPCRSALGCLTGPGAPDR